MGTFVPVSVLGTPIVCVLTCSLRADIHLPDLVELYRVCISTRMILISLQNNVYTGTDRKCFLASGCIRQTHIHM